MMSLYWRMRGRLQESASKYDLILASDMLMYIGDLAPLLESVRRALRPGGRFAFTVELLEDAGNYRLTRFAYFAHGREATFRSWPCATNSTSSP